MSRFWLVELHEDLAERHTTARGTWAGIFILPGVKSITDLSAISQATLDLILLKPSETLKATQRRSEQ